VKQLAPIERRAAVGDAVVLVVLTVAGFATHMTLDAFWRMIVTALGSLLAWYPIGVFMGVFREHNIMSPRELWRVALAWIYAAPLATFLRGLILGRDIPPAFVVVVILINGFGLIAWRLGLGWRSARTHQADSMSTNSPR
jgi:hypothetical protein